MSVLEVETLRMHVTEVLSSRGYRQRGGEFFVHCPWHQEKTPSLSCHVGYKLAPGSFHCFGCGEKGGWQKLSSMLFKDGTVAYNPDWFSSPSTSSGPSPKGPEVDIGRILDNVLKSIDMEETRTLPGAEPLPRGFSWRGLPGSFFTKMGARFYFDQRTLEEYLYFPLSMADDLYGYTLCHLNRREGCDIPKYGIYGRAKKSLFLYDQVAFGSPLVLVEGQFDALRLMHEGLPANAVLGVENFSKEKVSRIMAKLPPKVVVLFDGDDAGYTAARNIYYELASSFDTELIDLPRMPKESKLDPGNMPEDWVNYVRDRLYAT